MHSITIRDVPLKTRNVLASRAAKEGLSLQEYLKRELSSQRDRTRERSGRWSPSEFLLTQDAWLADELQAALLEVVHAVDEVGEALVLRQAVVVALVDLLGDHGEAEQAHHFVEGEVDRRTA